MGLENNNDLHVQIDKNDSVHNLKTKEDSDLFYDVTDDLVTDLDQTLLQYKKNLDLAADTGIADFKGEYNIDKEELNKFTQEIQGSLNETIEGFREDSDLYREELALKINQLKNPSIIATALKQFVEGGRVDCFSIGSAKASLRSIKDRNEKAYNEIFE